MAASATPVALPTPETERRASAPAALQKEAPRTARPTEATPARSAAPVRAMTTGTSSDPVSAEAKAGARAQPARVAGPTALAPTGASPCADMNIFARASCLSRACQSPQWSAHPQCVEARRLAEQRQRRMEQ